ncbi:MAG TPA: FtsX-like permease family protein, partial [Bacteroidia bacterium]|nr:FtsX-like permease family protein [Bacteroidia bacterium]
FKSLHENIKPLIIHIDPQFYGSIAVRIKPENISATINQIDHAWINVTGKNAPLSSFMDDDFAALYKTENNMQSILGVFTALSVFVACLGLFGLTAFTVKQRFREIGIRKVLGANVSGIVRLLSKDLLRLVCISILIGSPLAWLSVNMWLQDFAYRISISWWTFAFAGGIAIVIAFLTVSFQSLQAAIANPVKSLRTE